MKKILDCERIIDIFENAEWSLLAKLTAIADELSICFNTGIYFCEIKGKRWSFFAGSSDTVFGSKRFQVNDKWGIISDFDFDQYTDSHLIINIIRGMLSD